MKYKYKYKWKSLAVICLAALTLAGCKGGLASTAEAKEIEAYTLPQSMIIVATERNRYQQVYTDQLWNVTLSSGMNFETYLLDQVQTFLQNMKTMCLLAQDQNITLTGAEKDRLHRLSDEYYLTLSPSDIVYMGITKDDILTMYQDYYLANKVVSELTKELNLEVSDSEAKVISVQQIVLKDQSTADEVYSRVTKEGSDFAAIAAETSAETQINRQIGRGVEDKALEEAAFALGTGQISPVIQSGDKYYIFKCTSDYDEKATQERKTQIYTERKNQVFSQIYDQFQSEHHFTFSNHIWQNIKFSSDDKTTTTNFFELYKKEFGSQGH